MHTISRQSQPDFVFEVFERLNMGATQLNEQELRNCIYQGVYTDLLCDLAGNEHLLGVCRSKQPHLRMKIASSSSDFSPCSAQPRGDDVADQSLAQREIRENKDMTPQEADEMREVFQETIRLVWEVFGDCAFRPVKKSVVEAAPSESDLSGIFYRDYFENGEVNVALWDTVMHAFAGRTEEEVLPHREHILAAFIKLAGGATFRRLLVSQPKAVVARAAAWATVMDQICGPKGAKRGAKAR